MVRAMGSPSSPEIARTITPDAFVVDYRMPGMDGFAVTREIKTDPVLQTIPVLLLTGADSAQFVVDGLGAGADDFVTKGSDLEILLARLQALLRVKAYQDQLRKLNHQITRDLQIARRVQEALVPQRVFCAPGFEVRSAYIPSETLSGDFYDYFMQDDLLYLFVADVSGHGLPAAILVSLLKSYIHTEADANTPLSRFMSRLNDFLFSVSLPTQFATAQLFRVGADGTLHYANAAHPPFLLFRRATRRAALLEEPSHLLGAMPNMTFDERSTHRRAGRHALRLHRRADRPPHGRGRVLLSRPHRRAPRGRAGRRPRHALRLDLRRRDRLPLHRRFQGRHRLRCNALPVTFVYSPHASAPSRPSPPRDRSARARRAAQTFPADFTPSPCALETSCISFPDSSMKSAAFQFLAFELDPNWAEKHAPEMKAAIAPLCRKHATCQAYPMNTYMFCDDVLAADTRPLCDKDVPARQERARLGAVQPVAGDVSDGRRSERHQHLESGAGVREKAAAGDAHEAARHLDIALAGPVRLQGLRDVLLDRSRHARAGAGARHLQDQIIYAPSNPTGESATYYPFVMPFKYARVPNKEGHSDAATPMITISAPGYPGTTFRLPRFCRTLSWR